MIRKDKELSVSTKRKRAAAVISIALVLAIIMSGTYAWVSISQIAYNEVYGTPNPGGRIHDDYDEANKDVYAENFGTIPLFVRIKLNEYMESGTGAGLKSLDGGATPNPGNEAVPFLTGTDIDDKSGWPAHIPDTGLTVCDIGDNDLIHRYITWVLGGSKIFMPTFNKNLESLSTEASGSAIDELAGGPTAIGRDDLSGDSNDGSHNYWTAGETVISTEYYWDPDLNGGAGGEATRPNITHTAKSTLLPDAVHGGVMLMAQWKTLGCPLGNFWVYDVDGWAYWANALPPGESTGLLLNGLSIAEPDIDWYYCIDVIGQFATSADLDMFGQGTESITVDAAYLLDLAASRDFLYSMGLNFMTLDIAQGGTQQFTATVEKEAVAIAGATVAWEIVGTVDAGTTVSATGLLTVDAAESAATFIVRATWLGLMQDCVVTVTP